MPNVHEEEVGQGDHLLFPKVSTCLPFTLDLSGELVGAHLSVGSPSDLIDQILLQMNTLRRGAHIRASYAIGVLKVWGNREEEKNRGTNYNWPQFVDSVRTKLGQMFPVYAFDSSTVSDEVHIQAYTAGWNGVRFEVGSSKMFKMIETEGGNGTRISVTKTRLKDLSYGFKTSVIPNRTALTKSKNLGNLFRKVHYIYRQNCVEY